MVTPKRHNGSPYNAPTPASTPAPDKLTALVESGDLAGLRAHFDAAFWENRAELPGWQHLKIALLHGDRQMLRLLHAWGAAPADDDLAAFRVAVKEKYPDYLKALRAAGFRPQNKPWETLTPAEAEIPRDDVMKRAYEIYQENGRVPDQDVSNWLKAEQDLLNRRNAQRDREATAEAARLDEIVARRDAAELMKSVPQQWLSTLRSLQEAGAAEAVIAGDALRERFQDQAVGDIDIFLLSQGNSGRNKKFLKAVLSGSLPGAEITALAPEEAPAANRRSPARPQEHWRVLPSGYKNSYIVTFVEEPAGSAARAGDEAGRAAFLDATLKSFDLGLRQIACDGRKVAATPAYRDDVANSRISLLRPRAAGDAADINLLRLKYKYKDWTLNDAAKRATAPVRPPPPSAFRIRY